MTHSTREASRPPNSRGQETTESRSAASFASHSWCRAQPCAVSIEGSGCAGTLASSQARTSAWNASSSGVRSRFTSAVLLGLAKVVLEDLAAGVAGERVDELHLPRGLVVG